MNDRRASMMATLADILSKPSTPNRVAAAARIRDGLARMSEFAAQAPRGGGRARTMTFHDREHLMRIADDQGRSGKERDRAKAILDGNGDLSKGDVQFLDRSNGND